MISKQSTTRFSANGGGGASRGREPFASETGAPARASAPAGREPYAGREGDQIPVIWADVRAALEHLPPAARRELRRVVVEPRAEEDTGARARASAPGRPLTAAQGFSCQLLGRAYSP